MILKQYVVVTSGFKSPPTETHTLFSWLILIKSNSSSPPMCCLWSESKCWWATVWTDSRSLGMSFFYCLITCLTQRQHMCPALLTSAMICDAGKEVPEVPFYTLFGTDKELY